MILCPPLYTFLVRVLVDIGLECVPDVQRMKLTGGVTKSARCSSMSNALLWAVECNCTSVEPGPYGTEFLTLQFLLYVHRSTKGIITRSLLLLFFGDRLGDRIG
jgi:hypothetical protein